MPPFPSVVAVAAAKKHRFSKQATAKITLLTGAGVAGDALLPLEVGTVLRFGANAQVQITGLRKLCVKIDRFQRGLQEAVTARSGGLTYMKSAVMGTVIADGTVAVGDVIRMKAPAGGLSSLLRPVLSMRFSTSGQMLRSLNRCAHLPVRSLGLFGV